MPQNSQQPMTHLSLSLSYPPSVNTYWGFQGHRRFLTNKAREFKTNVLAAKLALNTGNFGANRVGIEVKLYPPDRRVRDIDNVLKPLLDALVAAGVLNDDGQIDLLIVSRETVVSGGRCEVCIKLIEHFARA